MRDRQHTPTALVRFLQASAPTNFRTKIVWVDHCSVAGAFATCDFVEMRRKRPHFVIELSRSQLKPEYPWFFLWETIIHEYAHAMAWAPTHRNLVDHGPMWGVAYAQCYEISHKKFA